MQSIRPIATVLLALLAGPALAEQSTASSPYNQVRAAIASMEGLEARLARDVERGRGNARSKAIECISEQHASIESLLDLAQAERARLVEAMADHDERSVNRAHRNVMLWNVKANGVADKVSSCPTQREYNVAKAVEKAVAEAEALGQD